MNLRLDRLASVYLAYPLKRRLSPAGVRIPILMYHSISASDENHLHPYFRTATSPQIFAEQMNYLHANGYEAIGPGEAVGRFRKGLPTSSKCVVITFDDGYRDFYQHAFPVLKHNGFNATVFLPTAYIGDQHLRFKEKDCLTWGEVCELSDDGIAFGSHTVTHPQLSNLPPDEMRREIVSSKQTIEDKLGTPVTSFAYPFAFPETQLDFKHRLRATLVEAGYKNGICTILGTADAASDIFFLERLPVNSCDDLPLFQAKLAGAYDWLHEPQYLLKAAKARVSGL